MKKKKKKKETRDKYRINVEIQRNVLITRHANIAYNVYVGKGGERKVHHSNGRIKYVAMLILSIWLHIVHSHTSPSAHKLIRLCEYVRSHVCTCKLRIV